MMVFMEKMDIQLCAELWGKDSDDGRFADVCDLFGRSFA